MNLMPWRNADADTKHDVIVMLVIHGVLYLTCLILYVWFIPTVWRDYLGSFPPVPRMMIDVSNHLRNNLLLFYLPITLLLPWIDTWIYTRFRERFGRQTAFAWLLLVSLAFLMGVILFICGATAMKRG